MGTRSIAVIVLLGVLSSPVFGQDTTVFCLTHTHVRTGAAVPVTGKAGARPIHENEPAGVRGANDTPDTAEPLGVLGSSGIQISGMLSPEPPILFGGTEEEVADDGAIQLARDVHLTSGTRVQVRGIIGDGLHGSRGGGTGDFDFYRMGALLAGQRITIEVDTSPASPGLNSKVALYDSTGMRLNASKNGGDGDRNSYLDVVIPVDGVYFAVVRGTNSWWPDDPFDPASGPKAGSEGPYIITLGVDAEDFDWYSLDMQEGDVLSAAVEDSARHLVFAGADGKVYLASDLDRSDLLPAASPLLKGGNANLALVIAETGRHYFRVGHGAGRYSATLIARRAGHGQESTKQVLFVDFDGVDFDASFLGGRADARLSPLHKFLENQGIAQDEDHIIDLALATLKENLVDDIQEALEADVFLDIQNSRDHPDSWGAPNVSRVIVGGSRSELGLETIGIAESVDVGNFVLNETAVVLLDRITDPLWEPSFSAVQRAPGVSMPDLLGLALGNIIAHEAGHLIASFHTGHADYPWQIMDASPEAAGFLGAGPDKTLGTEDDLDVDLGVSPYWELEGFDGLQDSRTATFYGLGGAYVTQLVSRVFPLDGRIGAVYPNPSHDRAWLPVTLERTGPLQLEFYDMLGRRQVSLGQSMVPRGHSQVLLPVNLLAPGTYLLRAKLNVGTVGRKLVVLR